MLTSNITFIDKFYHCIQIIICLFQACVPTPDMDKGNIYDDKPDTLKQPEREENTEDCTLKVKQ
jgi:hypothetical protein